MVLIKAIGITFQEEASIHKLWNANQMQQLHPYGILYIMMFIWLL